MKIRELVTWFGFRSDDAALERLDKRVDSLKGQLLGLAAMGAAGAAALFGMAKATANAGDEARDAAMRLGITAEAYQELAHAAALSGTSIGGVGMGIKRLSTLLQNAKTKGGDAATLLQRFGIDPRKAIASDKALEQIADRFKAMPNGTKKAALAVELFGRSGMRLIPLLNEGADGIRAMRQEARDLGGVISNETADASDAFNDSLEALTFAGKGLVYTIGAELLPVMTEIMGKMIAWWKANRAIVQVKLREWTQRVAKAIEDAAEKIDEWLVKVDDMIDRMGGIEAIAKKIALAFALAFGAKMLVNIVGIGEALLSVGNGLKFIGGALGVGGGMAALAILAVVTQALALVLVWEDFFAFLDGKDSVLGRFFGYFKGGKETLRAFGDVGSAAFDLLTTTLRTFGKLIDNILQKMGIDLSKVFDELGPQAKGAVENGLAVLLIVFTAMTVVLRELTTLMENLPAKIDNAGRSAGRFLKGLPGGLGGNLAGLAGRTLGGVIPGAGAIGGIGNALAGLVVPPAAAMAGGAPSISAGDVTVNVPAGVGSPEAVGREVKAGVLSALDEAARRSRRNYAGREE